MKRTRKYIPRVIKLKKQICYPIIFCTGENKVIGVSNIRYKQGKVQIARLQWLPNTSKFLKGYRLNFDNAKKGDKIFCKVCGSPVDFRMFPSDTQPELVGDIE